MSVMHWACCSAVWAADPAHELLLRRLGSLRGELETIGSQITELQRKMPMVEAAIEQLTERVGSLQMRQSDETAVETTSGKPHLVGFRPPITHTVKGDLPVLIVCQNRSVKIADFDENARAFKEIATDRSKLESFVKAKGGTLPAGDFDIQMTVLVIGSQVLVQQQLLEREGVKGETMEAAQQPSSRFRERLGKIQPGKAILQIAVYPDSFDLFRAVRSLAWEQNHNSIKWVPMEHGEKINIGSAGAGGLRGVQ